MKKILLFSLFIALVLVSCHKDINYGDTLPPTSDLTEQKENNKEIPKSYTKGQGQQFSKKVVIRTAEMSIEVKDLNMIKNRLTSLLDKYDAYIEQERLDNYSSGVNDYIEIRIKAGQFDSLLSDIKRLGKVNYLSINTGDYTAKVIDIKARLDIKLKVAEQYKQLLKQCKTVSEVMQVTEALRRVQEEIESMEALLKYYQSQSAYSTIKLTLEQPIPLYKQFSFWDSLKEAFWVGWQVLGYFVVVVIASMPFLLLALVIYLIVRWLRKKKRS